MEMLIMMTTLEVQVALSVAILVTAQSAKVKLGTDVAASEFYDAARPR